MAVRPDGTGLRVVERGVRNGEGLAVAPDGTVWTAVNERDNIPYPVHGPYATDTRRVRQGHQGVREQPPARRGGAGHRGTRPGLAVLRPGPGRQPPGGVAGRRPARSQRGHQPGRHRPRLRGAAAGRGRAARAQRAARHDLPGRQQGYPRHGRAARWSPCTARGTASRRRRPAVLWLAWDAAKGTLRPAVSLAGGFENAGGSFWGARWTRCQARTARCTSATTRPARSTGWSPALTADRGCWHECAVRAVAPSRRRGRPGPYCRCGAGPPRGPVAGASTSVNCPMSSHAPDGSMNNGTSPQVPADATRPGVTVKSCPSPARVARPLYLLRFDSPSEAAAATARTVAAVRAVVTSYPSVTRSGPVPAPARHPSPPVTPCAARGPPCPAAGQLARYAHLVRMRPRQSQIGAVLGPRRHGRQAWATPEC